MPNDEIFPTYRQSLGSPITLDLRDIAADKALDYIAALSNQRWTTRVKKIKEGQSKAEIEGLFSPVILTLD